MTKYDTWLGGLFDLVEIMRLLKLFEASMETSTEEEGEDKG